jgi:hypothetical protein
MFQRKWPYSGNKFKNLKSKYMLLTKLCAVCIMCSVLKL